LLFLNFNEEKKKKQEKKKTMSIAIFDSEGFISFVRLLFFFAFDKKDNAHQQNKRENTSFWIRFVILFEWCSNRHARQPR
jgi:hypothetical protein